MESLAIHPHDSTASALARRVPEAQEPAVLLVVLCRLAEDGLLVRDGPYFGLTARGWRALRAMHDA